MQFFKHPIMILITWKLSDMGEMPWPRVTGHGLFYRMNCLEFIMPCVPTTHIVDIELSIYLASLHARYGNWWKSSRKKTSLLLDGCRLTFHHVSGKRQNMLAHCLSTSYEEMSTIEREVFIPNIDQKDLFYLPSIKIIQTTVTESRRQRTLTGQKTMGLFAQTAVSQPMDGLLIPYSLNRWML